MTSLRPLFSIVSAVYNVAPYLAELIGSVEARYPRFDRDEESSGPDRPPSAGGS